ncbi:helix-turn-helix domain-containing protein [Candidatus Oscillochloris fontis]|uniref:helix-turn-helix domain-containing protein n=1 Tax=Candidatus Oscillochloris fontis TaxID=2496868 RepID=UPI001375B013|nr:helix-turn-helix transcriptional regulator [Candidatus Oscillochloris fontis]
MPSNFAERHRQIGAILAQARQREQRTITECAEIAATTRRRYTLIERGEAVVGAAELEALMRFLNVPAHHIWPDLALPTAPRQVIVQAQPGECVQFVVQVQG